MRTSDASEPRERSGAPAVTVNVPGPLREYCAGASQLSLRADTVRTALENCDAVVNFAAESERSEHALYRNICDETGAVRRHLNVFVNTENVRDLEGVDTKLRPGDEVTILPAVSGG